MTFINEIEKNEFEFSNHELEKVNRRHQSCEQMFRYFVVRRIIEQHNKINDHVHQRTRRTNSIEKFEISNKFSFSSSMYFFKIVFSHIFIMFSFFDQDFIEKIFSKFDSE